MICNAKDRAGLVVGATERVGVQISEDRTAGLPARRHPRSTRRDDSEPFCFRTILTDEDREMGNFVDDAAAGADDCLSGTGGIIGEGKPGR